MKFQQINTFIVDKNSDGLRIDKYINKKNKNLSRTKIKNLILKKKNEIK